jgi:hypothetical protein
MKGAYISLLASMWSMASYLYFLCKFSFPSSWSAIALKRQFPSPPISVTLRPYWVSYFLNFVMSDSYYAFYMSSRPIHWYIYIEFIFLSLELTLTLPLLLLFLLSCLMLRLLFLLFLVLLLALATLVFAHDWYELSEIFCLLIINILEFY